MTWTPNRPTEPGRYEVYLAMNSREDDLRGRLPTGYGIADIYLDPTYRDLAVGFTGGGMGYAVADSRFDGALWRPYVEPADPHASPQPVAISSARQFDCLTGSAHPMRTGAGSLGKNFAVAQIF